MRKIAEYAIDAKILLLKISYYYGFRAWKLTEFDRNQLGYGDPFECGYIGYMPGINKIKEKPENKDQLFLGTCAGGHMKIVKKLTSEYKDLNYNNGLMEAFLEKHVDIMNFMLLLGANNIFECYDLACELHDMELLIIISKLLDNHYMKKPYKRYLEIITEEVYNKRNIITENEDFGQLLENALYYNHTVIIDRLEPYLNRLPYNDLEECLLCAGDHMNIPIIMKIIDLGIVIDEDFLLDSCKYMNHDFVDLLIEIYYKKTNVIPNFDCQECCNKVKTLVFQKKN